MRVAVARTRSIDLVIPGIINHQFPLHKARLKTTRRMEAPRVYSLIAALLVTCSMSAPDEHGGNTALNLPQVYPATVLYSDSASNRGQCEDINNSPVGKHAWNEISSDIRKVVNEYAPAISRSRFQHGKCAFGHCEENPAFSCAELKEIDRESGSGLHWIRLSNGSSEKVYCDFKQRCNCSIIDSSAWTRVAFFNMSDPAQNCPFNFRLNEVRGRRLCHTKYDGCTSVFFDTLGFTYGKVCGRVVGLQFGEPNAFKPFFRDRERSLEDLYVDGISLTHGQAPRTHIWTFAMVEDETQYDYGACPCSAPLTFTGIVPPFIGNDYFCDTGSRNRARYVYYLNDPLWDGDGCGVRSTCCEWQNPPWFCKSLPAPTRNSLEFRVCTDSDSDDEQLLIELIEIYIQ